MVKRITDIKEAVAILNEGGVIGYPTEAVWGLGCDPYNKQAVEKLLQLKSRAMEKGLIQVAADISQLQDLLSPLDDALLAPLQQSWPGPTTWVIPDFQQWSPNWIRGRFNSVAIRVSDHPLVSTLSQQFGGTLVSTSANPAGQEPAMNSEEVAVYFGDHLDAILEGELGELHAPTQIKDLLSGQVVRAH